MILLTLASCKTDLNPAERTNSHLSTSGARTDTSGIPTIVNPVPLVPAPTSSQSQELYNVVVQEQSIRDVLFEMSRDASINIDVDPNVSGTISLNAIDQSLPQILERISHQANIRWSFDEAGNLVVRPDDPYWVSYNVNYVNVQRTSSTTTDVSTSLVSSVGGGAGGRGGAGGGNNSSSSQTQTSNNNFWLTLNSSLSALLSDGTGGAAGAGAAAKTSSNVVINAESGVVTVRATARQHAEIAAYIKNVETRSLYQVLIEATVVEVTLGDKYQAGVDWATLARNNGQIDFIQNTLGANLSSAPVSRLVIDRSASADGITATIALLSQFGESRVLSSPKLMALNNQSAMLSVVDNKVYFTIDVQPGTPGTGVTGPTPATYTTAVHTIPVGIVLNVTPQVGSDDQVTLNIRPTISRILGYVNDPNPILADAGVTNQIPEIQVREMESVLKVFSGQIAILGGLMQDSLNKDVEGTPGLSRMPVIRNLFSHRKETASKTELIIFIRPVVVKDPSVNGDLKDYQQYLPNKSLEADSSAIDTSLVHPLSKGQSE